MDKTARQHRTILLVSLVLCFFIYIDSYFIPTELTRKKVEQLAEHHTGRRGSGRDYTLAIDGKSYDIPGNIFQALSVDEEVELEKSAFTGALQKIGIVREREIWVYEAGYVRARFGKFAVPSIIIGCIAMLIFFKIIDNIKGRANLTYVLFVCSILLFFAHLDLNIF